MRKNTKRYIVSSLNNLELSPPIRYERKIKTIKKKY